MALANRQLATDSYSKDLKKKLFEMESERTMLRDKMAETKGRLKGIETALEEARDEAEGKRASFAVL